MSKSKGDYQCPYCGAAIYDDDRVFVDEYDAEEECPECEKKFLVSGAVSVSYTATGDCKLAGMLPHQLKQLDMLCLRDKPEQDYECVKCKRVFYHFQMPDGQFPKIAENEFIYEVTK